MKSPKNPIATRVLLAWPKWDVLEWSPPCAAASLWIGQIAIMLKLPQRRDDGWRGEARVLRKRGQRKRRQQSDGGAGDL